MFLRFITPDGEKLYYHVVTFFHHQGSAWFACHLISDESDENIYCIDYRMVGGGRDYQVVRPSDIPRA